VSLTIRYANGTTVNRPMNINGTVVDFPGTGAWSTWASKTITVNLAAGANLIRATATTANGGPNTDYLEVGDAPPQPSRFEAENAVISQGLVEANHLGYSGTGFVNGDNIAGSYVEYTVNRATAGSATIVIRYSNGTTTNRPSDIAVNGTVVTAGQSFGSTTNWDTWANVTLTVNLTAGANMIRITSTTANGPPNLDYLDVM
jgi:hypothetical protein